MRIDKMTRFYLLLINAVFVSSIANAQFFEQEVGVRIGESSGLYYKKFVNDFDAIRPMLTFRSRGVQATVLAEFHEPLFKSKNPNFSWYWGFGAHLGYRKEYQCRTIWDGNFYLYQCKYQGKPDIGIDGLIGFDFTIVNVPMVLSFEYKPYINLLEDDILEFHFGDFAFGISYAF